jgi:DNA-binding MarR family transcriptional regulator
MRKLYPFGWIDRDLKELGFLRDMSASAAKLYILYVLAGGIEGKSCYSAKALIEATGLSKATICRARQELEAMGLVVARKEMVRDHKNKKLKVCMKKLA